MRAITIIGGGQSGLQLGIGLLKHGYKVRLVQDRTAEEIRTGRVLSSQAMFGEAIEIEREFGIDFWTESLCPPVEGISFTVPNFEKRGEKLMSWASRLDRKGYSVDQRLKMPAWMAEFERLGGKIVIRKATIEDLESYRREDDLLIVATGKGEIRDLFERDNDKSVYEKPTRALSLTYVTGMTPRPEFSAVCFNLMPGLGEYFVAPALTKTGPCEIMIFAGIPGGPLDCWDDVKTPQQHLETAKRLVDTYLPWEADRCRNVELTDDNGILAGRVVPTVRKPIGALPSGAKVLGIGDAILLNDPLTGQGSNNASKAAKIYLDRILAHGDRPFDDAWMQGTFDAFWDYAQWVVHWTNIMVGDKPPHVMDIMGTANVQPDLARRIANGFDDPRDFFPWFVDAHAAAEYLGELRAA